MEAYQLFEAFMAVVLLVASFVVLFITIERYRWNAGLELYTDKFIHFLRDIYYRTDPNRREPAEVRETALTDKVKLREIYLSERSGKNGL